MDSDCSLEPDGSRREVKLSHHPVALAVFQGKPLPRGTLQSTELPWDPRETATTKGTLGNTLT